MLCVKSVDSSLKTDAIEKAIDEIKQMTNDINENPKYQNAFYEID